MTFKIYRLCRDKQTIHRIKEEEKRYSLPSSILKTGGDLFTFINEIIAHCQSDYALICHDDVILPKTITANVETCIEEIDNYIGKKNWGIAGNAGVEYLSKHVHTLLSDPHTKYLPPKYTKPIIAESLDGNTLLLNIKNLRAQNVLLPQELKGFHLYDLILCIESYKKNLACLISPALYVVHTSRGNYKAFQDAIKDPNIQNYFKTNFSNHTITSINDNIAICQDYSYLSLRETLKKSFENLVNSTVQNIFKKKSGELNIIVRIHKKSHQIVRLLNSINILRANTPMNIKINTVLSVNNIAKKNIQHFINYIKKQFTSLHIVDLYLTQTDERYPRVASLAHAVNYCYSQNKTSYSWFIDYDDFVFPDLGNYLTYLLFQSEIVTGKSIIFNEEWDDTHVTPAKSIIQGTYDSDLAHRIITGSNFFPICSAIYKTTILKQVFDTTNLYGDYFEDYAIALLTFPNYDVISTKISFAGISYHGTNTTLEEDRTHWNYSYATFLSEIINKGILDKNTYQYLLRNIQTSDEFEGFKRGKIWKTLTMYRRFRAKIRDHFNKYAKKHI